MNYEEALQYMSGLLRFGIKFGLDRFSAMCEMVGNPQDKLRVIHVGGTNGKGSTTTFISYILRAAGYSVGTYLSPYVYDVRERVQLNGEMIPKDDFAALMTEIVPMFEKVAETDLGQGTEFEAKTLIAFMYFVRKKPDFCAVEVGMGGTYDATNLVKPMVSVITNVSLDHMERLGETVSKIAADKAGIAKPGAPMITAAEDEDAWWQIYQKCRTLGIEVWRVLREDYERPRKSPPPDKLITYRVHDSCLDIDLPGRYLQNLKIGLKGEYQFANAATAAAALHALSLNGVEVPDKAFAQGIAEAYLPGRMEVIREKPTVILDAAHNPDGAAHLAQSIERDFSYKRLILVIGMLATHSAEGVAEQLAPLADYAVVTSPPWEKAASAEAVAHEVRKHLPADRVEVVEPVMDAVNRALEIADEDDLVLVMGSFHTIGEVDQEAVRGLLL